MDKPSLSEQFGPGGMSRDDAIILFLRGLRIVLNNAAAYPTDHPYFMKSVEEFKEKVDLLLNILNPIKLHFTPDSVFIDTRTWSKDALYVDLARVFHLKKIKSIEFARGVTGKELHRFLTVIGLPRRDFVRKGGCARLMDPQETPHIAVEELDYSMFLGEGSQEVDVWVYFLHDAIDKEDRQKIMKLAEGFGRIVGTFKVSDLADDEELRENIRKFIRYLKDNYRDKLKECGRHLFSAIDHYKKVLKSDEVERMKIFFREIDEESLARVLWDEMLTNEEFDTISLGLFVNLIDQERHGRISNILAESVADQEFLKNNPRITHRLSNLIAEQFDDQSTSAVYRNIIAQLTVGLEFNSELAYDRAGVKRNYRFILLTLLSFEKDPSRLQKVVMRLIKEWDTLISQRDYKYIGEMAKAVAQRKTREPALLGPLKQIEDKINQFLEALMWEDNLSDDIKPLFDSLTATSLSAERYIQKIFGEGRVNQYVMMSFFRFFPTQTAQLYQGIQRQCRQADFMMKLVAGLRHIDTPLAADMLKYIFSCSNEFIRVEVLKDLKDASGFDDSFLFSILNKGGLHLRRAVAGVLIKRESTREKTLRALLDLQTFPGFNVNPLLENMMIVSEFQTDEVKEYIRRLSRRRFFWNAPIRRRAQDILRRWDARQG